MLVTIQYTSFESWFICCDSKFFFPQFARDDGGTQASTADFGAGGAAPSAAASRPSGFPRVSPAGRAWHVSSAAADPAACPSYTCRISRRSLSRVDDSETPGGEFCPQLGGILESLEALPPVTSATRGWDGSTFKFSSC